MILNYKDYVGHENEFDFSAASQFSLLFHCGVRENSRVLDFGCGCLRLGRILIPYLQAGFYCGYDPNSFLYEYFIKDEHYDEIVYYKKPTLISNLKLCSGQFDYIIAHSIFTHTGVDLFRDYMKFIFTKLKSDGLFLCSFYLSKDKSNQENGWKYKDCFAYSDEFIKNIAQEIGFSCKPIIWWHPRQTWYAFFIENQNIPDLIGKPVKNIENILTFDHSGIFPDKYFNKE